MMSASDFVRSLQGVDLFSAVLRQSLRVYYSTVLIVVNGCEPCTVTYRSLLKVHGNRDFFGYFCVDTLYHVKIALQ